MKPQLKALLGDVMEPTTYFEMCWKPHVALGCAVNPYLTLLPLYSAGQF